jgi:tRNA nucleotidyltransferase (CCA-adding enzyme)
MALRHLVFGRFAVAIEDRRLEGRAWGEPVDRGRHMPAVEPKGATLTALKVEKRDDGAWVAQCIVDV